jgi:MarR-like DNA-binding transcriptional regulator SgrR of sgrS sRNA
MEQIEREYEEKVEQPVPTEPSNETSTDQIRSEDRVPTPGDVLRTLPTEAQQRGTRFISAQAMQAKLFSVYDAAAAAEDALALVQQQLTLTLNRSYYDAEEIEKMASQLDSLLALESIELELEQLDHDDLVSEA